MGKGLSVEELAKPMDRQMKMKRLEELLKNGDAINDEKEEEEFWNDFCEMDCPLIICGADELTINLLIGFVLKKHSKRLLVNGVMKRIVIDCLRRMQRWESNLCLSSREEKKIIKIIDEMEIKRLTFQFLIIQVAIRYVLITDGEELLIQLLRLGDSGDGMEDNLLDVLICGIISFFCSTPICNETMYVLFRSKNILLTLLSHRIMEIHDINQISSSENGETTEMKTEMYSVDPMSCEEETKKEKDLSLSTYNSMIYRIFMRVVPKEFVAKFVHKLLACTVIEPSEIWKEKIDRDIGRFTKHIIDILIVYDPRPINQKRWMSHLPDRTVTKGIMESVSSTMWSVLTLGMTSTESTAAKNMKRQLSVVHASAGTNYSFYVESLDEMIFHLKVHLTHLELMIKKEEHYEIWSIHSLIILQQLINNWTLYSLSNEEEETDDEEINEDDESDEEDENGEEKKVTTMTTGSLETPNLPTTDNLIESDGKREKLKKRKKKEPEKLTNAQLLAKYSNSKSSNDVYIIRRLLKIRRRIDRRNKRERNRSESEFRSLDQYRNPYRFALFNFEDIFDEELGMKCKTLDLLSSIDYQSTNDKTMKLQEFDGLSMVEFNLFRFPMLTLYEWICKRLQNICSFDADGTDVVHCEYVKELLMKSKREGPKRIYLYSSTYADVVLLFMYTLLLKNSSFRLFVTARGNIDDFIFSLLRIIYRASYVHNVYTSTLTLHLRELMKKFYSFKKEPVEMNDPLSLTAFERRSKKLIMEKEAMTQSSQSHHVYIALVILLQLSEDTQLNISLHQLKTPSPEWFLERSLEEISVGSLYIMVLLRCIFVNVRLLKDHYLHTNFLGVFSNIGVEVTHLHHFTCEKVIQLINYLTKKIESSIKQYDEELKRQEEKLKKNSMSELSENNSKSEEKDDDEDDDLEVSTLKLNNEIMCMKENLRFLLEMINVIFNYQLANNPELVYEVLYHQQLFHMLREQHPSMTSPLSNIKIVIDFFYSKVMAMPSRDVDSVMELLRNEVKIQNNPHLTSNLKKPTKLKYRYREEDNPEDFFLPYTKDLTMQTTSTLTDRLSCQLLFSAPSNDKYVDQSSTTLPVNNV